MFSEMRRDYHRKLEERLKVWKGRVDGLNFDLQRIENRAELNMAVGDMLRKKDIMKERWKALQQADNGEWTMRKEHLEQASEELKDALDRVAAYFDPSHL